MTICHICKEREAIQQWESSPALCPECLAEGERLLVEERRPKPAKAFRLSSAEEAQIRQQTADFLAWYNQQCFLPEPPGCDHSARDGAGNHWHAWSGLICGKRSVSRTEAGQHYCADHKPAPSVELSDIDRQCIINNHRDRHSPAIERIEQLRACHLYYSPELGEQLKGDES